MLKFIDSQSARRGALDSDPKGSFPSLAPVLTSTVYFGEGMGRGKCPVSPAIRKSLWLKLQDTIWGWLEKNKSWNQWFPGQKKKYKEHIKASPNNTIHHATRLEPANEPLKRQLSSVVQSYNHSIKQLWPYLLNGRLCEALGVSSPVCPYTTWITSSC